MTTEQVVESTTPDTTQTTDAPVDTEAPLEPFEVLVPGPYDVGVKTITINAASERPLTVDVWFPLDDAAGAPAHTYTLIPGLSDISDNPSTPNRLPSRPTARSHW